MCKQYVEYFILDGDGEDLTIRYIPGNIYDFWSESNKMWGETYFVKSGDNNVGFSDIVNDKRSFSNIFDIVE